MRSHIRNQDIGSEGIFFLIGKNTRVSDSHDIRIDDLKSEIELNGDFIVGDYVDSYRNLTLKTFSGYKYVHDSCSQDVKWILFQDDDTVVAEKNFQELLVSSSNITTCLVNKHSREEVIRADSPGRSQYEIDHFSVSRDEYPLDLYPTYCGGPCTLLSRYHVDRIYEGFGQFYIIYE